MKTLALLSALFVGFTAQANTVYHQTEILPHVEINGEKTPYTAVLHIDSVANYVKAEIFHDSCGSLTAASGQPTCRALARVIDSFEAQLTERKSACGSAYYKAESDDTPRDGVRVHLLAADHEGRVCRDLVRSAFEVDATVFNPWTNKTTVYYLSK